MADVRAGVDQLDREIVTLLTKRFGYMTAAARIKHDRMLVRDEDRKARVIAQAVAEANAQGIPGDVVGKMWDILVEGSIEFEFAAFDRLQSQ